MPLISVVSDRNAPLLVLYASEANYVIDYTYSLVTLELAVLPPSASRAVTVILDGRTPSASDVKRLCRGGRLRELLHMSGADDPFDDRGIIDFRETFFDPALHTNQDYEGPYPEITPVSDAEVQYLGQVSVVPKTELEVAAANHLTLLTARPAHPPYEQDRIQLFRLGVLLRRADIEAQTFRRLGPVHLSTELRVTAVFRTGFFSYRTVADYATLSDRNLVGRISQSRLALTLDPFVDMGQQAHDPLWTDEYRTVAGTDVWVVGWGPNSVALRSPRDLLSPVSVKPAAWGLYPQRKPSGKSMLADVHLQPALHIPEFAKKKYIDVLVDPSFEVSDVAWEAHLPGVTIRRIYNELSLPSGLPALLLTILFAFVTEGAARVVAILALAVFGVIAVARLIRSTRG